jgi:hypothetical protein
VSRLPPQTQKSNNTLLNLKKEGRKKSTDVITRKKIEKKHRKIQ